jgi:hypothetical protein
MTAVLDTLGAYVAACVWLARLMVLSGGIVLVCVLAAVAFYMAKAVVIR